MGERASINEVTQWGLETTSGTEAEAKRLMSALVVEMGPEVEVSKYRPSGGKFNTVVSLNKEWVTAGLSGPLTYTELIYPLSSILQKVNPTGVGDAKSWAFAPSQMQPDTVATYTVEMGSDVRAQKFTYGLVTSLGFEFSMDGCALDGDMMGGAMEDDVTMTAAPTALALRPILPRHVSVFLEDDPDDLDGATPLQRVVRTGWNINKRFAPVWVLNQSTDWAAHVEVPIDFTTSLRLQADEEGMSPLQDMREGATKWLRILCESHEEIEAGTPFSLTIDTAVKVTQPSRFEDEAGQLVIEYTMDSVYDADWGKATEVTVVNDVAAL